jgi:hypothetical protein
MKELKLVNGYGQMLCTLTKAESIEFRNRGEIVKVGRDCFRLIESASPSKSPESPCSLHAGDMAKFASRLWEGGELKPRERERFIGHGLMSMPRRTILERWMEQG